MQTPPAGAAAAGAPAAAPQTPIADRYREIAPTIIQAALADRGAWDKLAYLSDRIGHRLSGSQALERAVAWAGEILGAEGHEAVRLQPVMVPHWVRGQESAEIVAPVRHSLRILGLGGTVGTGPKGVRAQVVVVRSFEELTALGESVRGKIVLFNHVMLPYDPARGTGYGEASAYRHRGASEAAKLGAVAVLVRSVTARSLRSPHTGGMRYDDGGQKIPAAAISIEDADLLARLTASGEPVSVQLKLGSRTLPDAKSANVIAELRGSELPGEIVVIGAHIDTWDVGQGAHDDGAGCAIVMQALTVLKSLGLRPRRTIRVVLFTNEENGLRGAFAYAKEHAGDDHVAALESDTGAFALEGFRVQGTELALAQMQDIVTLLAPVGATKAVPGHAGADLIPLTAAGVPGLGVWYEMSSYFDYHHTEADTLDKVNPEHVAKAVAAVATVAYVIADMPERFGGPKQAKPLVVEDHE